MANGLAPYLLNDIATIAKQPIPSRRLDVNGLLAVLYNGLQANPISTILVNGHKKEYRVTYRQRPTYQQTETTANCTDILIPLRLESTVTVNKTRQISFMLTDQLVASYIDEASNRMSVPGSTPSIGASAELMDIIYSSANALMTAMSRDYAGLVSWGKNVVANSSAAQTLALAQASPTTMVLTNGETKLVTDYFLSGLQGRPQVVGAGKFLSYMFQQNSKGINSSGMNTAIMAANWDFYPDITIGSSVGLNDADGIGVFESGSILPVEALEYQGFAAGQFPGDSIYGTLPLNYTDNIGNTAAIKFDFQLRYITCPTTFTAAYAGDSMPSQTKGWQMILKKDFGLFQTPADSYRHEDRNRSVNGALRYTVTNA
jgi:hypothetical protein